MLFLKLVSAESMIDKNKLKLSQIAFMQESKKDFEDGVPLAAYPFLISKEINPEEFVAKVEQVNAERDKVNNVAQMPQGGQNTHNAGTEWSQIKTSWSYT